MSRPILLSEEPVDEASDKDVSDATLSARKSFSIVIFLAGLFIFRRNKRSIFYQSKADTAPTCSHGPLAEK
jgi:hypothetical protein